MGGSFLKPTFFFFFDFLHFTYMCMHIYIYFMKILQAHSTVHDQEYKKNCTKKKITYVHTLYENITGSQHCT